MRQFSSLQAATLEVERVEAELGDWRATFPGQDAASVCARLQAAAKRMYPIQDGPSVPWEVMAPHESQCQHNHSQSIARIAERGGFGCCEAWAVVNGLSFDEVRRIGIPEAKRRWLQFAERVNLHYAELERLRSDKENRGA